MRLHITLEDAVARELDHRVGPRRRSAFITSAVRQALEDERRWELIGAASGAIAGDGHEWDRDAAAWVRDQRRVDPRRVG